MRAIVRAIPWPVRASRLSSCDVQCVRAAACCVCDAARVLRPLSPLWPPAPPFCLAWFQCVSLLPGLPAAVPGTDCEISTSFSVYLCLSCTSALSFLCLAGKCSPFSRTPRYAMYLNSRISLQRDFPGKASAPLDGGIWSQAYVYDCRAYPMLECAVVGCK